MVDVNVAVKLYNDGNTLRYIGEVLGVSKQRVWQLLKRHKTDLTRKHRRSGTIVNTASEKRFLQLLRKKKLTYERMGRMSSFDVLINNKKVEIKYMGHPRNIRGHIYFHFTEVQTTEPIDLYVFICGREKPKHFIVPPSLVKNTVNIAVIPKYKKTKEWQKKYLENWALLQDK